jgi:formylglycine-generating enzyme required for sulfatase activity/predicted Ser/Thr protein kinase
MDDSPPSSSPPSGRVPAEQLLAAFQLVPHAAGEEADFDALCAELPEAAPELRALRERWLAARAGPLGSAGPEGPEGMHRRLARVAGRPARYRVEREIARGGMGRVLLVWDDDLARPLAMKVAADAPEGARLARFVEEALVSAQLDHPGIVPVHELGVDAEGRAFFTMKLVRGRTLQQVFEELHRGEGGWTRTRVLGLLLKACEAMAYAHDKGVVHRDLKPANVMVGRFGEVYVMDWGVAKVLAHPERRDLRVREAAAAGAPVGGGEDAPLVTVDGHVLGTPAYMSPEQAEGLTARMGPASDVYAIGAMLYHLLAGRAPYAGRGEELPAHATWLRVRTGPPEPIGALAPDAPAELVAICEKAMARDPDARYQDVSALAEDLSACLEGRVVRAHRTGAWAEFRKWMERNRAFAGALAAAIVLALAGTSAVALVQAHGRRVAARERNVASQRAADVLRLSALQDLDELTARADALWPAHPERIEAFERWIADAERLTADLPEHRAQRERLGARSAEGAGSGHFTRSETEARWWHAQLTQLIDGLEALLDRRTGLLSSDGLSPRTGASVPARLAAAQRLRAGFAPGGEHARRWEEDLPRIRAAYPGLDVAPQMGLVPIGPDPDSGLWEFAHLGSGELARRGESGRLELREQTGIVLVLLPGASLWIGSQADDPDGWNFDLDARGDEGPVRQSEVPPWFVSKYETTQAQWRRLTGANPSLYTPGWKDDPDRLGEEPFPVLLLPVERVSQESARLWLARAGLSLPPETVWEHAARAGTRTPWSTGANRASLAGFANLFDVQGRRSTPSRVGEEPGLDDGAAKTAPVGSYAPNRFGLHDVHGNVWEWCLDRHSNPASPVRDCGDAETAPPGGNEVLAALRGGSFHFDASHARCARRTLLSTAADIYDVGFRAAYPVVR